MPSSSLVEVKDEVDVECGVEFEVVVEVGVEVGVEARDGNWGGRVGVGSFRWVVEDEV